jgi:hypothetical protein
MLRRDWEHAHQDAINAINDFREAQRAENAFKNTAQDARAAERGRQQRGGLQLPARDPEPARPQVGCPPNCQGNNNPTGPAGVVEMPSSSSSGNQLEAGSSGLASSSIPE